MRFDSPESRFVFLMKGKKDGYGESVPVMMIETQAVTILCIFIERAQSLVLSFRLYVW